MTLKNEGKTIALTGGGTAGHVMPHFAMLDDYRRSGWNVIYIGSKGIEKELMSQQKGVTYYTIASGKLRRYFSWENFTDLFRVATGTLQSIALMLRKRPKVIFSKGGFVSVPVAVAAWSLRIPVVSHESDLTPGLATKIITRFAARIFYSFPETAKFLPKQKSELVGLPIRADLFSGNRLQGETLCGFNPEDHDLPTVMVMGGSLGAQKINDCLKECLPELVKHFRFIHITGKGKGIDFVHPRYKAFEFVKDELKHLFAATDLVIARAGANSIFEFLALQKPMLLIPLESGSRGDQIDNAKNFATQGWAEILAEKELTKDTLMQSVERLKAHAHEIKGAQTKAQVGSAREKIMQRLQQWMDA